MTTGAIFFPQTRAERLIGAGRFVLAAFSLLAIYLDPSEPARYAHIAYAVLTGYLVYAALLLLLLRDISVPWARLPIVTHVIDLAAFFVLNYFTEGPTSPFFVFFIFSLICATLRWDWRATLWTGVVAISGFIAMGLYMEDVWGDPDFELNRFIVRGAHLSVITMLLAYLGYFQEHCKRQVSRLTGWPAGFSQNANDPTGVLEMLENSAATIGVPRVIMAWQDPPAPGLYLAAWSKGEFHTSSEAPSSSPALVAGPLAGKSFLCDDVGSFQPRVLHVHGKGLEFCDFCYGTPLNIDFQNRFDIFGAVLSPVLSGEYVQGRLFFLDKRWMTSDDLVLAEIVARMIATRMDASYLAKQLEQAAAAHERVYLAHRLHDSLLQSLAVMSMQMEMIQGVFSENPGLAKERLAKVQTILRDEQRALRSFVGELKVAPPMLPASDGNSATHPDEAARGFGTQRAVRVEPDSNQGGAWIPSSGAAVLQPFVFRSLRKIRRWLVS